MSAKPKILCVGDGFEQAPQVLDSLRQSCETVTASGPVPALSELARDQFAGMFLSFSNGTSAAGVRQMLQDPRVLENMPDGLVLLDTDNIVVWANEQFRRWTNRDSVIGESFYLALGKPEILGPDFCPFQTALVMGQPSSSNLRVGDSRYFQVRAAAMTEPSGPPRNLIVTVRDVTGEILQQQKLEAIHKAGIELADLKPAEIFEMEVQDRIELLKLNIVHYTQDLLHFDVIEIRLLDQTTGRLEPLLSVGMEPEAEARELIAQPKGNGVTGFVAATGKSYLCEDTTEDPLYIEGFKGAKSSMTVPLMLHDQVIGTFNVESPHARAFTESDLQFLEIFSRDLAVALNTLELLSAQRVNACQESVERIHREVALPVDEILNDAVNVMERYIGHDSDVMQRLRRILRNARDIKQVIQEVGKQMAPTRAVPPGVVPSRSDKLQGTRVLVVDADENVRVSAHDLLERSGCVVETAHEGGEAIFMVRNADPEYDVVIADIRLPDLSGYELLVRLRETFDPVPLVLMTGFGYDPGHSIVKARQAGLHPKAVLYKPFRLDQLLEAVEIIADQSRQHRPEALAVV